MHVLYKANLVRFYSYMLGYMCNASLRDSLCHVPVAYLELSDYQRTWWAHHFWGVSGGMPPQKNLSFMITLRCFLELSWSIDLVHDDYNYFDLNTKYVHKHS